jgi:hypothetical protein
MKAAAREHGRCFKCGHYFLSEDRIRHRQECRAPRHTFVSNMGFARDRIERGEVVFDYCQTDRMVADRLTKAVPFPKFEANKKAVGLVKKIL